MIWAVSLSTLNLSTQGLFASHIDKKCSIRSFSNLRKALAPFQTKVLYPYHLSETLYLHRFRGKPAKTKFEGISLLTATHPSILQHALVRSSDREIVDLATVRSLGFGSKTSNSEGFYFILRFHFVSTYRLKLCWRF